MNGQEWIPIKRGAQEDTPAVKEVRKSGLESIQGMALDRVKRIVTQVRYETGGVWKGTFEPMAMPSTTPLPVPQAALSSLLRACPSSPRKASSWRRQWSPRRSR